MAYDDGGNAFPIADYDHHTFQPENVAQAKRFLSGMSLRDFFAASALQGFCANASIIDTNDSRAIQYAAEAAYQMADVMLSIRT